MLPDELALAAGIDVSDARRIISLAHHLGIAVTAEGVETASQLARLRQLECEHVQGFYFAAPLDSAAATALLRAPPTW